MSTLKEEFFSIFDKYFSSSGVIFIIFTYASYESNEEENKEGWCYLPSMKAYLEFPKTKPYVQSTMIFCGKKDKCIGHFGFTNMHIGLITYITKGKQLLNLELRTKSSPLLKCTICGDIHDCIISYKNGCITYRIYLCNSCYRSPQAFLKISSATSLQSYKGVSYLCFRIQDPSQNNRKIVLGCPKAFPNGINSKCLCFNY
jgi:hypothetical protein